MLNGRIVIYTKINISSVKSGINRLNKSLKGINGGFSIAEIGNAIVLLEKRGFIY